MNPLTSLQEAVAERLGQDEYFADAQIQVLTEKHGDIEARMTATLAKIGLGLLVLTPQMSPGDNPHLVQVSFSVQVAEHVMINRAAGKSGIPAADAVWRLLGLLWDWTPLDGWTPLQPENPMAEVTDVSPYLVYNCRFTTETQLELTESET